MTEQALFRAIRMHATAVEKEIAYVLGETGIPRDKLLSPCRENAHIAMARHLLMYRLRVLHRMSYPHIASALGRDPSTVIHGVRKAAKLLEAA